MNVVFEGSDHKKDADALLDKWLVWQDILLESRTNAALAEALDRAKIIYEITRKHDTH